MESKLFTYFAGRLVNVILKSIKGRQEYPNGQVSEGNVVLEGYLLSEDDKFYYFGKDQDIVDEALDKNDVVRIFETPLEDRYSVVFDDAEDDGSRQ